MSKPIEPEWVPALLASWNVRSKSLSGWKTHNRNGTNRPWGPVHGLIWHHTGADTTNAQKYAERPLYSGWSDLPGPLCHIGLAPDGTAFLVGWGRANHAGGGDPAVLEKVISEDYTGILKPHKGNTDGVDGNARFYGMEIMYSGTHGMTPAQYTAALKISCAILEHHGWSEKSVIGHGEWSRDKWDPGYSLDHMMDMNAVRNDIRKMLDEPREKPRTGEPVGKKTQTYKEIWEADVADAPKKSPTAKTNKKWKPISFLQEIYNLCIEIRDLLKEKK